jgi:hypothetical protein
VRINPPYDGWQDIHTLPYGQALADLDVSADGTLLSATMEEVNGNQYLRLFRTADLLNGNFEPIGQFDFGRAVPEGFVFSPDGKYLYGSSYYTGVSNIFRYEVATGDIQAVSNAETGFFLPVPLEDGSLIVFEYTGQGFVSTRIDPEPLEDLSALPSWATLKKHRWWRNGRWALHPDRSRAAQSAGGEYYPAANCTTPPGT